MDAVDRKDHGPRFGVRHLQCLLLFSCHFVMYTLLQNVPLAIVAMTDSSKANPDFEEFDWDEKTRASVLSSFLWGYTVSQIPCGSLAVRYGNKAVLLVGVGVNSIVNLVMPICTIWGGSNALLTLRVMQGLFQGVLFPSTHGLIASWAPVEERSHLGVFVFPGAQIGTVVALSTGGVIAASDLGWPGIFYLWGVVGLVWCFMWWCCGADGPSEHKSITPAEREYILSTTIVNTDKLPTPWGKIFRSRAFWALMVTQTCACYSFWTITTITPTFLKGIFQIDIQKNALMSAVPSIGLFVFSHFFAACAKFCSNKLKFTLRTIRILFNSIGFGIPAIALISLGFINNTHHLLAVILLTIAYGTASADFFGYYVNHIDLCPTHAAPLMGVTNAVATVSGIVATLAVGWVVPDETNPRQWQIIFSVGAVLYIIGILTFAFFGRFENQNWVEPRKPKQYVSEKYTPSANEFTIETSDNNNRSTT